MTDSQLTKILLPADDEPCLPPSFQRQVWLRIESASTSSLGVSFRIGKIFSLLKNPLGAVATVLLTTFIGLGLGAGSVTKTENGKEAYVESVSPFASPRDQ